MSEDNKVNECCLLSADISRLKEEHKKISQSLDYLKKDFNREWDEVSDLRRQSRALNLEVKSLHGIDILEEYSHDDCPHCKEKKSLLYNIMHLTWLCVECKKTGLKYGGHYLSTDLHNIIDESVKSADTLLEFLANIRHVRDTRTENESVDKKKARINEVD